MTITTRYDVEYVRRHPLVRCPVCGKDKPRTLVKSFALNGFHNADETRRRIGAELDDEADKLKLKGAICPACEKEADPLKHVKTLYHVWSDELITYKVLNVGTVNLTVLREDGLPGLRPRKVCRHDVERGNAYFLNRRDALECQVKQFDRTIEIAERNIKKYCELRRLVAKELEVQS